MALGEVVEFVEACVGEPVVLLALLKGRGHLGGDHVETRTQRSDAAGHAMKLAV